MIRQWFAALNDVLDELIRCYPQAIGEQKIQMHKQWDMLKTLSDDMIELWLRFEDKMAVFREMESKAAAADQTPPECEAAVYRPEYVKGQGYFKLQMFAQAAAQLERSVTSQPDFLPARLYLAMSRMHLQQWEDAQRHFQLIAALSDDRRLQAIAYNALGCIQAVFAQLDQAQSYFRKAVASDPTYREPQINAENIVHGFSQGHLQLQFGSAELQTLA